MKYKLAIVKNRIRDEKKYKSHLQKFKEYIAEYTPLNLEITEFVVDEDIVFKPTMSNAVTKNYMSKNGFKIVKTVVEPWRYHQVLHVFERTNQEDYKRVKALGGNTSAVSAGQELFMDTEYTESSKIYWKHFAHECMHAFVKRTRRSFRINTVDHMDSTVVNGERVRYYKNNDPTAEDGNYARTLNELKGKWHLVVEMKRAKQVLRLKLELLLAKLKLWK